MLTQEYMSQRLDTLKSMVDQNPNNTFARYGLAMEHANSGDLEQAIAEYRALLAVNADYAAAYFHGGQTLEKLGRKDEARQMYQQGIEATVRNGDAHTRSELQAALDLLG
jgi:tetratricopeptide (TPR) repeat protein